MQSPTPVPTELDRIRGRLVPWITGPDKPGQALVPGQLHVGLGVETPGGVFPIEPAELARLGASVDDLMPTALENLRRRSSAAQWHPLHAVPGMLVYLSHDANAAARMLILRDLLEPWPFGGVLVSVPTPDQLLVVPLDRLEHLPALQVLVQSGQLAQQLGQTAVTDQVFWFDGHEWAHVQVRRRDDEVDILPPPNFLKIVERLTALTMSTVEGEA